MALTDKLTAIANAIRCKTGGMDALTLEQMPAAIEGIEAGGGTNEELTAMLTGTITEFRNKEITSLRGSAFAYCSALKVIDMPNLKRADTDAFRASGLQDVTLPSFEGSNTAASNYLFGGCKNLTEITLPSFTIPGMRCFMECSNLKKADFATLAAFGNWMFYNCPSLDCLILRHDRVVANGSSTCLQGTPFASGGTGGTVYVPQAKIEEYKVATNWSALYEAGTCNFAAIEGSEYE